MSTSANIQSPDFAFPRTVSADAKKELAKINVKHHLSPAEQDLYLSLQIQYYLAETLIDSQNAAKVISMTDALLPNVADPGLRAMLRTLVAKMYYTYYEDDSWTFNRRSLPLDPVPSDISQWSGEMFRRKISGLCLEALKEAPGTQIPISDFAGSVQFPVDLSKVCYPDVADFVAAQGVRLCEDVDAEDAADEITEKYISRLTPGSAQAITWQLIQIHDDPSGDMYSRLEQLYTSNSESEYSALVLLDLVNSRSNYKHSVDYFSVNDEDLEDEDLTHDSTTEIERDKQLAALIEEYLHRYPQNLFTPELQKAIKNVCLPRVRLQYANLVSKPNLTVTARVQSADEVEILVYNVPTSVAQNSSVFHKTKLGRPIQTYKIRHAEKAPFLLTDTVVVNLPDNGYFLIVPRIKGVKDESSYYKYHRLVRRVPILPISIANVNTPHVVVVDAASGAPTAKAVVTTYKDSAQKAQGVTNADGVVAFPLLSYGVNSLKVTAPEGDFLFPDTYLSTSERSVIEPRIKANILTDRSIYHPGEEVNFMAVLYCTHTSDSVRDEMKPTLAPDVKVRVKLNNANFQEIDTLSLTTDSFGRVSGKFVLPADGLTGRFQIYIQTLDTAKRSLSSASFMVSDYKMPQFEIAELNVERDTPTSGSVTINGTVATYAGMPVAEAKVKVELSVASFRFWEPPRYVNSFEISTDSEGKFTAVFTEEMLDKQQYPSGFFSAKFIATSQAGETVERTIAFSAGKPYLISLSVPNPNIDGEKPYAVKYSVVNAQGQEQNIPLRWSLIDKKGLHVAEGHLSGPISLANIRPGKYNLCIAAVDDQLADSVKTSIVIYNVRSGIAPTEKPIWCVTDKISDPSAEKSILIATSAPSTWLYTIVNIGDNITSINSQALEAGYHNIPVQLPEGCRSASVTLLTVKDCSVYSKEVNVRVTENRALKITAESMRDRLTPGASETWKFRITDSEGKPVRSAVVLDLYNKALEALMPHYINVDFPVWIRPNSASFRFDDAETTRYEINGTGVTISSPYASIPYFNFYGISSNRIVYDLAMGGSRRMYKSRSMATMALADAEYELADGAAVEEEAADEAVSGDTGGAAQETSDNFAYREAETPVALWAPMLETDAEGFLTFTFTVPNAVTTWRLQAVAWSEATEAGDLMRDFIANKPLMVQPLMPRFLRQGDSADIRATVFNNSEDAFTATITFEIFNPLTRKAIATEQQTATVAAGGQTIVTFRLSTLQNGLESLSAVGVRIKGATDTFADGETTVLPLLSSMAQLIETTPFYLNPGDSQFSTLLPGGDDVRLSLTYSANPVWSVVSALPGLREQYNYANSAAAALFSASVARGILADNPKIAQTISRWLANPQDSMLVSNLEKNDDLKIALLSATPWVENAMTDTERMQRLALIFDKAETDAAVARALETLQKLQRPDGGFAWGSWSNSSSYWTTLNVLAMMGDLVRYGHLPEDPALHKILVNALKYVDNEAEKVDLLYAAVRPDLAGICPISPNGKKVITNTANDILKHWKTYPISIKAIAATALYLNGYKTKSKELLRSLEEFSVATPGQGIVFPNINSLSAYACVLDAFAMIEPSNPIVDGLRQQLIVRKQATDWGSSVVTSEVVSAILSSGAKWTSVDAGEPLITAGNTAVNVAPTTESATGTLRVNLSPYSGAELVVRRQGDALSVPAYGAVYAQFKQNMAEVKAQSCDDLSIEKHIYKRLGTGWVVADSLGVGDRVKVSLTIISKRNLQYVSMIDERPAAFAPVDQLPGWIFSEGTMFYRENRDAATNLSIDYLAPGTYILEYEMNVQHAGVFSSGVASIQSQYAPEISAHSAGTSIIVNP